MKEFVCSMVAILAALGVLMTAGALIEGGAVLPLGAALAVCVLTARGAYLLAVRPVRRPRRGPTLRVADKESGLRAA